jgi:hypothetical protein
METEVVAPRSLQMAGKGGHVFGSECPAATDYPVQISFSPRLSALQIQSDTSEKHSPFIIIEGLQSSAYNLLLE